MPTLSTSRTSCPTARAFRHIGRRFKTLLHCSVRLAPCFGGRDQRGELLSSGRTAAIRRPAAWPLRHTLRAPACCRIVPYGSRPASEARDSTRSLDVASGRGSACHLEDEMSSLCTYGPTPRLLREGRGRTELGVPYPALRSEARSLPPPQGAADRRPPNRHRLPPPQPRSTVLSCHR